MNTLPVQAKNIPAVNKATSVYDDMGQQHLNSMFINPVNEAEVIRIIKLFNQFNSIQLYFQTHLYISYAQYRGPE